MEKKNIGFKVLVVILSLLVLLLCGYIVYDKVLRDDDIKEENKTNVKEENKSIKLDKNKDFIYDANYNLKTEKESYYGYSDHTKLISASDLVVPYINIDSEDGKKVNQEIYKLYEDLINKFNKNLKDEISFTLVEYNTYINNDVISVVITTETAGTDVPMYNYYTYSFNLDTGKLLSYNDAYKSVGLKEDNITDKATKAVTNVLEQKYSNGDDFDTYNHKCINNYKTSVNDGTIKFFIDDNNRLNVIVTLEYPVGNGRTNTIITVE